MPLPEKRTDETTPAFVARCMGDAIMSREYPDQKQRYAVCVRLSGDNSYSTQYEQFADLETVDVGEIDIMGVGNWKGINFTENDLREIANNFDALKDRVKPWLVLGHSGRMGTERRSGMPAVGWWQKMWYDAKSRVLRGHLVDVPKKLAELIKAKAYNTVSAEYIRNFVDDVSGKTYNRVAVGVALLGAELPAVTTNRTIDQTRALYSDSDYEHEIVEWKWKFTNNSSTEGGVNVDEITMLKDKVTAKEKALQGAEDFIAKVCEKFTCSRDELLAKVGEIFSERDGLKKSADDAMTAQRTSQIDALFSDSEVSGKLLPTEEETYRTVLEAIEPDKLAGKIEEFKALFVERTAIGKQEEKAEHDTTSKENFSKKKETKSDEAFDASGFVDDIDAELHKKGLDGITKEAREEFVGKEKVED